VNRHATSAVLASLAALAACDSVDVLLDCQSICDKYQDCFDPDYDVGACRARCQENADDDDFADQIDRCESCIDDRTCEAEAFVCGADCDSVVP
jgi:hypothetical protein